MRDQVTSSSPLLSFSFFLARVPRLQSSRLFRPTMLFGFLFFGSMMKIKQTSRSLNCKGFRNLFRARYLRMSIEEIRNCVLRCSTHVAYTRNSSRKSDPRHCALRVIRNPRLLSRGTTIGTINRRLCERGYRRNQRWYKSYLATLDPITYNIAPITASRTISHILHRNLLQKMFSSSNREDRKQSTES